mmetsp:Transcript_29314/g.86858  ORF Transcript_29314/g.86858 Transcript_29314/m.86858 type:complete len:223 (-) Transcript_29314:3405-4073(-)
MARHACICVKFGIKGTKGKGIANPIVLVALRPHTHETPGASPIAQICLPPKQIRVKLLRSANLTVVSQQLHGVLIVNGRGHKQRRSLHLLDRVDVVAYDGVHQAEIEVVCGRYNDVQFGPFQGEGAAPAEGVEQVEGSFPLAPPVVLPQYGLCRFGEDAPPVLFNPHISGRDGRCAQGVFVIELPELRVEHLGDLGKVDEPAGILCCSGARRLPVFCPSRSF